MHRSLAEQLWFLPLRDLPEHGSIQITEVRIAGTEEQAEEPVAGEQPDRSFLIRIRRPTLTSAPRPPRSISDYLRPGWEDPEQSVELLEAVNLRRGFETIIERFDNDPARVAALEQWTTARGVWAEAEKPARRAMRTFERFYELHGRMELDSERVELMIADGRLRWRTNEGAMDHPVLLQRVDLIFDADVPEFRVTDADRPPELYAGLLQSGGTMSAEQLNRLRHELEAGGYHPLALAGTAGYLRRLVQLLGPRGNFLDRPDDTPPGPDPVVARDPVLFMRTRSSGFAAAFDRVLEDLETREQLPISITRLTGIEPPPPEDFPVEATSPWSEPPDLLLSKPANAEQIHIARALDRHGAVLVQGPPGTGKSHTIANLIGHLVAHGKRVLVTSHTTKALRVLRDHVVEPLRPLCVAVLENDLAGRTLMEESVRTILSRLTGSTEEGLEREVSGLAETRSRLNAEIGRLTSEMQTARQAEYVPIVVAGQSTSPSDAARWVRDHANGNDWIPHHVEPGAPLPLSPQELDQLYQSNTRLTPGEESEIASRLPDSDLFPEQDAFDGIVHSLDAVEPPELAAFWDRHAHASMLPCLTRFADLINLMSTDLAGFQRWQLAMIAAGHANGADRDLWLQLDRMVGDALDRWEKARALLLDYEVELPENHDVDELLGCVREIIEHLEAGGTLGAWTLFIRRRWKNAIPTLRVNGAPPSSLTEFRAVGTLITITEGRRKLAVRWLRQAEPVGLPPFADAGPTPEPVIAEYAAQFEPLLDWWRTRWADIESAAVEAGFRWNEFRKREVARSAPVAPFDRDAAIIAGPLQATASVRLAIAHREQAKQRLAELDRTLSSFAGPVCTTLRAAARACDAADYDAALTALHRLTAKQPVWKRRAELLERMAQSAPGWADAIRRREDPHHAGTLPGDAPTAWRWRQLRQEIERRAALDEVELSRQLYMRREELRIVTAQLIEHLAWLEQMRRTGLAARQALQGWADTQRRIGRGTGLRVPQLQARARELLSQARDAVPVWIMPLSRVAESFDATRGRFDVVIVDEASQSDVLGLLAWYLGDRIAVVGDHEQVSPLAVGQQMAAMQALIAQYLAGIPNNHLYDGRMSIYDLARQCFGGAIALREHFRCVPDIIDFSNHLSYHGEIRPLRDPGSARLPHVVELMVNPELGPGRNGKENIAEARVVAALVKAVTEMTEYDGKTLGAIALLGDEQAQRIQDTTISLVGAVELESRRFIAGNPAQFQGDERHVMFLSMVDSPADHPLSMRQTDLFKQRYNVAASRARDQLWLIHSLDPGRDLQELDLRRLLIEHVRDPGAKRRQLQRAVARAESPFEAAVSRHLILAGYPVEPQVWVGNHRIDIVVGRGTNRVAIECDGDRYHGFEQIPADMARQAVLERVGWRFVRIRGTRFFRDPDDTMARAFEQLARLEVNPAADLTGEPAPDAEAAAFRKRVLRRAWEIMRERDWLPEPPGEGSEPLGQPGPA
ncbi:MAG: AAA domain-containing protein [Longimicrobiales bacterium]